MNDIPTIDPLPQKHRRFVFVFMLVAFLLALPVLIFYALGYRYNYFAEYPVITATGGIYIASNDDEAEVFLNEKEVKNARVFRKAFYIQGLEPGIHHLHVQEKGHHTWVKDLQIFSQIVTEVEVFNLPLVPQIRPITEFSTKETSAVFFVPEKEKIEKEKKKEKIDSFSDEENEEDNIRISDSALDLFKNASSTINYLVITSSSSATTSTEFKKVYKENSEYEIINELFLEKENLFLEKDDKGEKKEGSFGFVDVKEKEEKQTHGTSSEDLILEPSLEREISTTTKEKDNLRLEENDGEVYLIAKGLGRQVPFYFCVAQLLPKIEKSPILRLEENNEMNKLNFGEKEGNELFTPVSGSYSYNNGVYRTCRSSIKMDRQEKEVIDFDFLPENSNLILMHLEDGIYLTEADDRSWQNSQPVYLGKNLEMLVYRGSIFVKENGFIFEVIIKI